MHYLIREHRNTVRLLLFLFLLLFPFLVPFLFLRVLVSISQTLLFKLWDLQRAASRSKEGRNLCHRASGLVR